MSPDRSPEESALPAEPAPPQVIPPAPYLGPLLLGIPEAADPPMAVPLAQPVVPLAAKVPESEFAQIDGDESQAVIRRRPYTTVGLEALWLGLVSVVLSGFLLFLTTRTSGIYFGDMWAVYVLHLVVLACGTAGIIIGLRDYFQSRRRRVVLGGGLILVGVLLNLIVVAWLVTTIAMVMIRDLAG